MVPETQKSDFFERKIFDGEIDNIVSAFPRRPPKSRVEQGRGGGGAEPAEIAIFLSFPLFLLARAARISTLNSKRTGMEGIVRAGGGEGW